MHTEAWRDLLETMETAIAFAEANDLDLGIEPELANVVVSAARPTRLISELGSDVSRSFSTQPTSSRPRRSPSSGTSLPRPSIFSPTGSSWLMPRIAPSDGAFAAAGKGVLDYPHYMGASGGSASTAPLITHGLDASEARVVGLVPAPDSGQSA